MSRKPKWSEQLKSIGVIFRERCVSNWWKYILLNWCDRGEEGTSFQSRDSCFQEWENWPEICKNEVANSTIIITFTFIKYSSSDCVRMTERRSKVKICNMTRRVDGKFFGLGLMLSYFHFGWVKDRTKRQEDSNDDAAWWWWLRWWLNICILNNTLCKLGMNGGERILVKNATAVNGNVTLWLWLLP